VTLAQRLLLAIAAVTITTAALAGLAVREAWRRAEEQNFEREFAAAKALLSSELASTPEEIRLLVAPVCDHDPIVDSALVGLRAGDLDQRRLSISLRVPELAKAFQLDELVLLDSHGEVLGALGAGGAGRRDPGLAARVARAGAPALRTAEPLAVEFACRRGDGDLWVGLYAARHLDPLLARVGKAFHFTLARGAPEPNMHVLSEALELGKLEKVQVTASRARQPLVEALDELDTKLVAIGGATLAAALLVAFLLSRGMARPIVQMALEAREVAHGEPKPVKPGGGRELVEFAEAFNRAIADLVQLRRRLAVTERIAARREIARRVAHEIKNPLAPIRAAVETLRRLRARGDAAFDEYFDEATRTVLDEVLRISNIVTEFTRFARLPAPQPAPMDLAEVARSVVSLHAGGGSPVVLAGDPRLELVADRDQMVQVLTNLVQNAIDAVRDVPEPRVTVELGRSGERARLSVRDNGPGFSPEVRKRLFEPYLTTKVQGTGLGLAIVQRIVVEHGGDITAEHPPEGGAVLVVDLPLGGPTLMPDPGPPSSDRPAREGA
jgi:two-component system, NtrC family, nitrogen regulation sensor histidine kinase NtrY